MLARINLQSPMVVEVAGHALHSADLLGLEINRVFLAERGCAVHVRVGIKKTVAREDVPLGRSITDSRLGGWFGRGLGAKSKGYRYHTSQGKQPANRL